MNAATAAIHFITEQPMHGPMVPEFVAGVLVIVAGVFLLTTIGFGIAWFRARERAIRLERDHVPAGVGGSAELARIEQAVEAIAIEVERMSEAERFQTKLLASRMKEEQQAR